MTTTVEGPDGTEYELPEVGETVTLSIEAKVRDISTSESRAPILVFSFVPATDRLAGFDYEFYPWEVDWE